MSNGEGLPDNPPSTGMAAGDPVSSTLCAAYRRTVDVRLSSMEDDIDNLGKRQWYIISGVIVSILLLLVQLAMQLRPS